MKVLRKKLHKVHIVKKIFYFLSLILYLASLIYFIIGILKLGDIETVIRSIIIAIFCVWFLVYAFSGLLTMLAKKNKTFIFLTIITLILCPVFTVSSYFINNVYGKISNMNRNTIIYTTHLITLKETNFTKDLSVGMVTSQSDNIEGSVLGEKLIEKEGLKNKIYKYEDYESLLTDLEKGKIGGAIVPSNYETLLDNYEADIEDKDNRVKLIERIKILYEYSEERKNQDVITLDKSKDKKLTEPFTVLVMGVDSAKNGLKANQAFNGDTLMLITFNPNTLTATMFSLPRDLYVPIACNHNKYAKINSSAAYGSSCVIKTVQQLTDINIDYYVKMNFQGVVDLVNALGGVTVDIEEPDFSYDKAHIGQVCEQNSKRQFGSNLICIKPGVQKLDGEQALAYARCRHLYAIGDIARNQHQQQVIEAIAHELKNINSITEFEGLLETVSNNIETNMTPEQMMSFYSVGKDMLINSSGNSLSIKKTYLSYYNLPVWQRRAERYTSALGYYPESLEAIKRLMKVNLELEKEKPVKTFSISYNEEYHTPLVGKGLTGGGRLELVKSFVGSTETEALNWCQMNQLTCTFETKTDYQLAGLIVDQSAHKGELVKSISKITFYISNGQGTNPNIPVEPNPGEEDPTNPENPENPEEPDIPGNPDTPTNPDNNQGENQGGNGGNTEKPDEEEKPPIDIVPSEQTT